MSLETGTYVNDLVVGNPPGSDKKAQGDDHLRLIKTVLRNTFPQANKPLYFPRNASKTTGYNIVAGDDKTTFSVDTSGGQVNLTLPTLGPSDGGWSIEVLKVNGGTSPVFLFPPSGTINGFNYVRRTLEFMSTRVLWNGSGWYATRPNGGAIGSLRVFCGPNLPNDCLWPNGQTFSASLYAELAGVLGTTVTPDLRARAVVGRNNMGGGASVGWITAGINFDASVLGITGGNEGGYLAQSHLPNVGVNTTFNTTGVTAKVTNNVGSWVINNSSANMWNGGGGGGLGTPTIEVDEPNDGVNVGHRHAFSLNGGVTQVTLSNLPPCMVLNYGIVAE